MKPTLQKRGSIGRLVGGTSKLKKATNKQKGPTPKTSEVLSRQLSVSEETRKEATRLEPKSEEVFDLSTKIKLQLFPVDEVTRIGLEKDGLNPFLELTLRARKKISSVINHIHSKWGASTIAVGDPTLLPYESHTFMNNSRWTSKDTSITAGEVYTAVKCPAVFRLSYGWFCDHEPPRVSLANAPHNYVTSESIQKQIQTTQERKCLNSTTAEVDDTQHLGQEAKVKMGQIHKQSTSPWDDDLTNLSWGRLVSEPPGSQKTYLSSNISFVGLLSEASLQEKLETNEQQPPFNWNDGLTALSIGRLLSEASLQAKMNKSDPKSFISDSFDAILSSQLKNDPQVSILDAEQTCHAFSSPTKNVSNSYKSPGFVEGDKQAVHAEDTCDPQQYNEDSRSLGLRGINWNESLGPFDLGWTSVW